MSARTRTQVLLTIEPQESSGRAKNVPNYLVISPIPEQDVRVKSGVEFEHIKFEMCGGQLCFQNRGLV